MMDEKRSLVDRSQNNYLKPYDSLFERFSCALQFKACQEELNRVLDYVYSIQGLNLKD